MSAPTMPAVALALEYANAAAAYRDAETLGLMSKEVRQRVRYARKALDAQVVPCPTCGDPLPGLLAQCDKPACVSAEIAEDAAIDRRGDI